MKKYNISNMTTYQQSHLSPPYKFKGESTLKMFIFWCCIIVFTRGMLRFWSTQLWYHDQMLEITQFFIIWNKKATLQFFKNKIILWIQNEFLKLGEHHGHNPQFVIWIYKCHQWINFLGAKLYNECKFKID
jgi:hypothetical protein